MKVFKTIKPTTTTRLSLAKYTSSSFLAKDKLSVAPMVDVTNCHFNYMLRLLTQTDNIQLYSEMINCTTLLQYAKLDKLKFWLGNMPSDTNLVVQLAGSNLKDLELSSQLLLQYLPNLKEVNFNLGCPSPTVQAGRFGAILMKDKVHSTLCIQAIQRGLQNKAKVTVKTRLGVDHLDSEQFLFDFVGYLAKNTEVEKFIIHARKCILKGLSPEKNRSVPPLNYPRVTNLANQFQSHHFVINGGFSHLELCDQYLNNLQNTLPTNLIGIMVGRKVRDDPRALIDMYKLLDKTYNLDSDWKSCLQRILPKYIKYYLQMRKIGHRPNFLYQPLKSLVPGKLGRQLRLQIQMLPIHSQVKLQTFTVNLNQEVKVMEELFHHLL